MADEKTARDFFDSGDGSEWSTPAYEPLSVEEKKKKAETFRDIFKKPQMQELDRQLDTAKTDYKSQLGRTQANYQRQYDMLADQEARQRRQDLESSIARGAGRSGVVDYMDRERGREYSQRFAELGHREAAEADALAAELNRIKRQVPEQRQQLAEQAARVQAQELQRLRDLDYQRRMEGSRDQFDRMLGIFDRTQLTPVEQLQLYTQLALAKGQFPGDVPDIFGRFGVGTETASTEEAASDPATSGRRLY